MKKNIIRIAATMIILGGLVGCGQQTSECTFCNEEKVCQIKEMMGEEVHICEECINEMEGL